MVTVPLSGSAPGEVEPLQRADHGGHPRARAGADEDGGAERPDDPDGLRRGLATPRGAAWRARDTVHRSLQWNVLRFLPLTYEVR